jgi:hypothetical protein
VNKNVYVAPAAIIAVLIVVAPTVAGQAAAYGVLAFAGYKIAKLVLGHGKRQSI